MIPSKFNRWCRKLILKSLPMKKTYGCRRAIITQTKPSLVTHNRSVMMMIQWQDTFPAFVHFNRKFWNNVCIKGCKLKHISFVMWFASPFSSRHFCCLFLPHADWLAWALEVADRRWLVPTCREHIAVVFLLLWLLTFTIGVWRLLS